MSSEGQPTTRLTSGLGKWEYRIMRLNVEGFFGPNIDLQALGNYLNTAGDEGWELVNIVDVNHGNGGTKELLAVLKRAK